LFYKLLIENSRDYHNLKVQSGAMQFVEPDKQGLINILPFEYETEDIDKFKWLRGKEKQAFDFCLQRIKVHNLPMKLVAVRYFFNEKKGIFYYTADGRIDFRQLVKDLAKELKMRIEMRQIGVRDEARLIGGVGRLRPAPVLLFFYEKF